MVSAFKTEGRVFFPSKFIEVVSIIMKSRHFIGSVIFCLHSEFLSPGALTLRSEINQKIKKKKTKEIKMDKEKSRRHAKKCPSVLSSRHGACAARKRQFNFIEFISYRL